MKWLVQGTAIIILFILQLALAELRLLESAPNLTLVYLCLGLAFLRLSEVLYLALLGGVLLDFFSALPDGIMLAACVLAVASAQYLGRALFSVQLSDLITIFHVALGTMAFFLVIMLASQVLSWYESGASLEWSYMLRHKLGADMFLNLFALYPVFLIHRLCANVQKKLGVKNEPV